MLVDLDVKALAGREDHWARFRRGLDAAGELARVGRDLLESAVVHGHDVPAPHRLYRLEGGEGVHGEGPANRQYRHVNVVLAHAVILVSVAGKVDALALAPKDVADAVRALGVPCLNDLDVNSLEVEGLAGVRAHAPACRDVEKRHGLFGSDDVGVSPLDN